MTKTNPVPRAVRPDSGARRDIPRHEQETAGFFASATGPLRKLPIRHRLRIIIALGVLGIGGMTAFFFVRLKLVDQTLEALASEVKTKDDARVMQVSFKKQVQEWKNVLLRGFQPADLARYRSLFVHQSDTVRLIGAHLQRTITDDTTLALVARFMTAHDTMAVKYEAAYGMFVASGGRDAQGADRMVRGQDRAPTDLIDSLVARLDTTVQRQVATQVAAIERDRVLTLGAAIVTLLMIAAASALIARSIVRPIQDTVNGLERIATGDLHFRVAAQGADEISRMNRALNVTVEAIETTHEHLQSAVLASEAANRAKGEFLANMSHEIRTPMNGIIGMTELTLDGDLPPDQRTNLLMVKESADSLLTIINDVLDFSKIDAGRLDLEQIDFRLRDCVEDGVRLLAERAATKNLELVCDIHDEVPEYVRGDPGRVRQILLNLVSNAIKFSREGEVVVRVMLGEKGTATTRLLFSVADTGIGIHPDRQSEIFKAFTQADSSTTREFGGTGLGLTICSQLVSRMGGSMSVQSELGRGSTFHFDLQLGSVEQPSSPPADPTLFLGMRALIVDDNATNRHVLAATLAKWGVESASVSNAAEALALVGEQPERFRLVFLDAQMPVMDGFALAEHLKRMPHADRRTLVMLTSAGKRGDAVRCRLAGIEAYLLKPFKRSELFTALRVALAEPASGTRAESLVTRHTVRESRAGLRVLLAEDNIVNQKVAAMLIEREGHAVTVAADGDAALRAFTAAAADDPFHIVFMDVQMPVMDGLTATMKIREFEGGSARRTCIIALTANAMAADREQCMAAGMDDFLPKPIVAKDLRAILSNWSARVLAGSA